MNTSELKVLKKVITKWAKLKPFIIKVYLYGSKCKGTNSRNSDIDIAIEFKPVGFDENCLTSWLFESEKWENEIQALLKGYKLHLEYYEPNNTPRVKEALGECNIILYSRE